MVDFLLFRGNLERMWFRNLILLGDFIFSKPVCLPVNLLYIYVDVYQKRKVNLNEWYDANSMLSEVQVVVKKCVRSFFFRITQKWRKTTVNLLWFESAFHNTVVKSRRTNKTNRMHTSIRWNEKFVQWQFSSRNLQFLQIGMFKSLTSSSVENTCRYYFGRGNWW